MTEKVLEGTKTLMLLDNSFSSDARVEKEAKSLVQSGLELTVVCISSTELPAKEVRDGYTIERIITPGFNAPLRKGYSQYVQSLAKRILSDYRFSIVHCHDFYMLSIGAEIKKLQPKVKLIYDAHEFLKGWPFYKSSTGLNKYKGALTWKKLIQKEKKEIKFADLVLTITNGIARSFQKDYQLNQLPEIIGNYPEQIEYTPQKGYFHTKYNLSKETRIIVHTGTIYHSDEQIENLFKTVTDLEDVNLIFVGNRPRFFELEKMVESNEQFSKNIYFHPYPKNQTEVIKLLSAADYGLLHVITKWKAHKLGFSNRFVEYLMAELPVIGTPQQFTEDLNKKYQCSVFYKENKAEDLANAIVAMQKNERQLTEGAIKAKNDINWESESKKLITLYKDLIDA